MTRAALAARTQRLSCAFASAVLLALGGGCDAGPAEPRRPPPVQNVLLVTLDTLRADHLGAYGHPQDDTPTLDGFERSGTLFETAYTTSSVTGPSHASILTGLYPQRHGMLGNAWRLDRAVETLPELLRRAGFATAAFVSSAVLHRGAGLDRGFDHYDQRFMAGVTFRAQLQRRADQTVDAALAWIEAHQMERFFVWLHLFDPHAPYDPPFAVHPPERPRPPSDLRTLEALRLGDEAWPDAETLRQLRGLYHSEVRFVDTQLGRVLDALEARGLQDRTMVVVTADHGEELGEHARFFEHNRSLYEGVLRVPLLVRDPATAAGEGVRRVEAPVQILDVFPTILERVGLDVPEELDAHSLVPLLEGRTTEAPRPFAFAARPHNDAFFERGDGFALIRGSHKLIWFAKGAPELYDLNADPGEQRNQFDADDPRHAALRAELLDELEAQRARRHRVHAPPALEPAQRRRLEALGYLEPANGRIDSGPAAGSGP